MTTHRDTDGWQEESPSWQETYTDAEQRRRRRREMPAKLRRLGVLEADRDACIYDLCCGSGETLDSLFEMGFRNLHGVDFIRFPGVEDSSRFTFEQGDVRTLQAPDASANWLLNIHSLHHLQNAENVGLFLDECYRVLKPGGRLGIVDFPGSPQVQLAFRLFLIKPLLITPYLKWFGDIIQSEWHFLEGYLAEWGQTRRLLYEGKFNVVSDQHGLWYYYLTLKKPETR